MKKQDRQLLIGAALFLVLLCGVSLFATWSLRKNLSDTAVETLDRNTSDAAGSLVFKGECIYLNGKVSTDDLEGVSDDILQIIDDCKDQHALDVVAQQGMFGMEQLRMYAETVAVTGTVSDVADSIKTAAIAFAVIVVVLAIAGLYIYITNRKGAQG